MLWAVRLICRWRAGLLSGRRSATAKAAGRVCRRASIGFSAMSLQRVAASVIMAGLDRTQDLAEPRRDSLSTKPQMGETLLEALHRLQEIEQKLAAIRRKREVKARRVEASTRKAKQTEEQLKGHQRQVRERQVRLDALSLDVAAKEETVQKHREALNRAKTNKEYAAILAAMNTEKADTAKLESGVLELMEEIQTLKNEASEVEAAKQRLLEEIRTTEDRLAEFDSECHEERTRLEADRDACSSVVPPSTLQTFTRVAESLDGEAMAAVTKMHPNRKEYVCAGCNMTISLEIVNALQSRDEIQQCGSCGRILHVDSSSSGEK